MKLIQRLLAYLYPNLCPACDRPISPVHEELILCPECTEAVRPLTSNRCPVCARPFASSAALSHSPMHRCGDCREDPPDFASALIPYVYEGPLVAVIRQFKYRKRYHLGRPLTRMMIRAVGRWPETDLVLPVPLHADRLRERGYNQAALLARPLARYLGRPFDVDLLLRIRPTPQQVGLSREERVRNVRRAFKVVRPEALKGKRILLVDDVFTTGATFNEAARALHRSGAKEVVACALARMVPTI